MKDSKHRSLTLAAPNRGRLFAEAYGAATVRERKLNRLFQQAPRLVAAGAALLLFAASAPAAEGRRGWPDPIFNEYPFARWVQAGDRSPIRWKLRITPAQLSYHQRLLARVEVQIDGSDLAQRTRGQLLILVEVVDDQGAAYQNHGAIDLEKLDPGIKASNIQYSQSLFLLPGNYRVAAAIVDTATGEHGARTDKTRVAPLKNDPLPEAWRDLPPVEIVPPDEEPEAWYLPAERGRLRLTVTPTRPLRVNVLLNLAATTHQWGALRTGDRNLAALIPTLKAISQIDSAPVSLQVALLDLVRQSVVFRQDAVKDLDWPKLKDGLAEAQPGTIDVRALERRRQQAAFFVKEVARRVEDPQAQAVIVLSNAVVFETAQDLQAVGLPAASGHRVFYMRFHHDTRRLRPPDGGTVRRRPPPIMAGSPRPLEAADDLAGTIKSLSPKVYDVHSPEDVRRALAAVLAEIEAR